MAVGIPVPQVVLVRLKGTCGSGIWNNVFHLQYTGAAPTVADLTTVGTAVRSAWTSRIAPAIPTTNTLTGLDLADLTNPAASGTSITASAPGTRAGTSMPNSIACVTSWQVNVRYRGGHPRTYWPAGVAADVQAGGRLWTTAFIAVMQGASDQFRGDLNLITASGATYRMVAVSTRTANAPRPFGVPYTIVNNAVHGRVDTQRHRLGKETP